MTVETQLVAYVLLALLVALMASFLMTPVVKTFAYKIGRASCRERVYEAV